MQKFKYEGFNSGSATQKGEIEASTKEAAVALLRARGIYLQQIVPVSEEMKSILPDPKESAVGSAEPQPQVSAFVPADGFTGIPRDGVLPIGVSDAKSSVEPVPHVEELFPEEGQFKAGGPASCEGPTCKYPESPKEQWQIDFKFKIEAFTKVMEELAIYITDKDLLKQVMADNLGYIVGQTVNQIQHEEWQKKEDKIKKACCNGGEEDVSCKGKTKRKKK